MEISNSQANSVQESLFYKARNLFGQVSAVTASVQNPGVLKTQDDVDIVSRQVREELRLREEQFHAWKVGANKFMDNLKDAFIKGEL